MLEAMPFKSCVAEDSREESASEVSSLEQQSHHKQNHKAAEPTVQGLELFSLNPTELLKPFVSRLRHVTKTIAFKC
jgi:hypothetical protein